MRLWNELLEEFPRQENMLEEISIIQDEEEEKINIEIERREEKREQQEEKKISVKIEGR